MHYRESFRKRTNKLRMIDFKESTRTSFWFELCYRCISAAFYSSHHHHHHRHRHCHHIFIHIIRINSLLFPSSLNPLIKFPNHSQSRASSFCFTDLISRLFFSHHHVCESEYDTRNYVGRRRFEYDWQWRICLLQYWTLFEVNTRNKLRFSYTFFAIP